MKTDSYAESLEDVLKSARNIEVSERNPPQEPNPREEMLRAAALVAILSMVESSDDLSQIGRDLGPAWAQDHRRTRMGKISLMEERRKRATWR